jgi:hypothetical protein
MRPRAPARRRSRLAAAPLAVVASILAGCDGSSQEASPPPDPTPRAAAPTEAFVPGQVWTYRTREGEEGSLVHIGMVERVEGFGTVVHVMVSDVRVPRPGDADPAPEDVPHLALTDAALRESVLAKSEVPPRLDQFFVGYQSWKAEVASGAGGVLELPVADVLELIEARMNPERSVD